MSVLRVIDGTDKCQPNPNGPLPAPGRRHVGDRSGQGAGNARIQLRSPDALVSAVTDAVLEEIAEWQSRPLEPLYALGKWPRARTARRNLAFNDSIAFVV